ncbi:MAG: hypothetical protein RLO50_06340, partial [Azospirillaceae bacterium]
LIYSEPQLGSAQEFDNDAESFRVLAGTWRFFRDAGYGVGSGPSFDASPGTHPGCQDIQVASGGSFPGDRLSAVQLLNGGGPPTALIFLFDNAGFASNQSYRALTQSEADFGRIGFDNRVAAVRVVRGTWQLFRNAGYGETPDRPSVTLPVGSYENIALLPGYPPNTFPPDLMSSAGVVSQAVEPPPPADCPAPYLVPSTTSGQCQLVCGAGTVPAPGGQSCQCQQGLVATGQDGQGRLTCGPAQLLPPPTLQVQCGPNAQFSAQSGGCVCNPGTVETGRTAAGQPICLYQVQRPPQPPSPGSPQPPQATEIYVIDGATAVAFGQQRGLQTQASPFSVSNATCMATGAVVSANWPFGFNQANPSCRASFLTGGSFAPGWALAGYGLVFGNPYGYGGQRSDFRWDIRCTRNQPSAGQECAVDPSALCGGQPCFSDDMIRYDVVPLGGDRDLTVRVQPRASTTVIGVGTALANTQGVTIRLRSIMLQGPAGLDPLQALQQALGG